MVLTWRRLYVLVEFVLQRDVVNALEMATEDDRVVGLLGRSVSLSNS